LEANRAPRALLLDDDKYALEFLKALLNDRYPELEVDMRLDPDPSGEYDFYFLDDDFEGIRLAGKLARRIRSLHPGALILAFSATLDVPTLKELIGAGCNGVCNKNVPSDMPQMLAALDRCMEALKSARQRPAAQGSNLLQTFRELFREWNRRLGSLE
jgi:hypothetical protein